MKLILWWIPFWLVFALSGSLAYASVPTSDKLRETPKPPELTSRSGLVWPAQGILTSRYGWRQRVRRHHWGIDIASRYGTPVYTARRGVVRWVGWRGYYGLRIVIEHGNGLQTVYGHLARSHVKEGQLVLRGDRIADVGCTGRCTGPHLHFEVWQSNKPVNPLHFLD